MPTPRRYANPAQRQAAYRARLTAARERELQAQGLPRLPKVPSIPGTVRWAALQQQALLLLQTMQEEMQEYYDERSEVWQASERGEAIVERLQAIQEAIATVESLSG